MFAAFPPAVDVVVPASPVGIPALAATVSFNLRLSPAANKSAPRWPIAPGMPLCRTLGARRLIAAAAASVDTAPPPPRAPANSMCHGSYGEPSSGKLRP